MSELKAGGALGGWPSKLGPAGSNASESRVVGPALAPAQLAWSVSQGSTLTPVVDAGLNVYCSVGGSLVKRDSQGFRLWEHLTDDWLVATPAVLGGALFTATSSGHALALELATGKLRWRSKFCECCANDPWAVAASGAGEQGQEGGILLLAGRDRPVGKDGADRWNDRVFALDARGGARKWAVDLGSMVVLHFAPCIAGEVAVCCNLIGSVTCLELQTGAKKWEVLDPCSPSTGGAVVRGDAVFVTSNARAKKAWNAPCGGRGSVRCLALSDGKMRWASPPLPGECNSQPCVGVVGVSPGRLVVFAGLGANAGTPSSPVGDSWALGVAALSAADGSLLWTVQLLAQPFQSLSCRGHTAGNQIQVSGTSCPVLGGDGTLYIGTMSGALFALEAASGRTISEFQSAAAFQASPALGGPGFLVLSNLTTTFCFAQAQTQMGGARAEAEESASASSFSFPFRKLFPRQKPALLRPWAESGTEHFWACKQGNLQHTQASPWRAPIDLSSKGPTWQAADLEGHRLRTPMTDFFHKTPVMDAQRNLYVATNSSLVLVLEATSGRLRGLFDAGPCPCNPVIEGTSLYVCDTNGFARCVDLTSLEHTWRVKYCTCTGADSWNPIVVREMLIVCGCTAGEPGVFGGNHAVFALAVADGSSLWSFDIGELTYNFMPSYLEGQDALIFSDKAGGMHCLRAADGSLLWCDVESRDPRGFSTGHCASGPNGLVYNCWNGHKPELMKWGAINVPGLARAYDARTGARKWTREFEEPAHVAPLVVKLVGGRFLCVVCLGENATFPPLPDYPERVPPGAHMPVGDSFQGRMLALDGDTGADVWEFRTPVYKAYCARGCYKGDIFLPDSWSSPTVGVDGTIYACYSDGFVYALEGSSGRLLSKYDMGTSTQAAPLVVPGMLVVAGGLRICAWRDEALENQWLEEAVAAGDKRAFREPFDFTTTDEDREVDRDALCLALRSRPEAAVLGAPSSGTCSGQSPIPEPDGKAETWAGAILLRRLYGLPDAGAEEASAPSSATTTATTTAASKPKEPAGPNKSDDNAGPPQWLVVGGGSSGGIVVRAGQSLKSAELGRLSTGARIEQVPGGASESSERLHYKKLEGDGPDFGWVSTSLKGKPLLEKQP